MAKPRPAAADDDARDDKLQELGAMSHASLQASIREHGSRPHNDIVDEWLRPSTVNIIVGDSGIGKSPLLQQLGLCVAAGVNFLGRPTRQGRVLHLMFESGSREEFHRSVTRMLKHLGLTAWPDAYRFWSPQWDGCAAPDHKAFQLIRQAAASLVLVDPLRLVAPLAENKPELATAFYTRLLGHSPAACHVISHHVRKGSHDTNPRNPSPDLRTETMRWLEQAAGTKSLITGAYLRLGVEQRRDDVPGDLLLAGYLRGSGGTAPTILTRVYDDEGEPIAYEAATGIGLLSERDRGVFEHLPGCFRFKDARAAFGGKSDSAAANFLNRCIGLDVLMKVGGHYLKNVDGVK